MFIVFFIKTHQKYLTLTIRSTLTLSDMLGSELYQTAIKLFLGLNFPRIVCIGVLLIIGQSCLDVIEFLALSIMRCGREG